MKTLNELKDLWNGEADKFNQWDDLGLDEIVQFVQTVALVDAAIDAAPELLLPNA
jgi:hypothetical protein